MANRPKTERNSKIWGYWEKGYRQKSIASMFKMKESAVCMVIRREKIRRREIIAAIEKR
tara:strand:+ start:469 stop:645 length:177 start_codon:yes stop_codon:yes gene_type:complete